AVDAIRCAKIALDNNLSGAIQAPSAYFMKSPPVQYTDDQAHQMVEMFAAGDTEPEKQFTPRKFSGVPGEDASA
ncbi:MAG: hypothetical protein V3S18_03540, partial [Dehalococcoidia bacterium]